MSDSERNKAGSKALTDSEGSRGAEMLHLDEEDVVLVASDASTDDSIVEHMRECSACLQRVEQARQILQVEPIERRSSSRRVARVMNRLTAAGHLPPDPRRSAHIRLAMRGRALVVLATDTQMRIEPRVAVRGDTSAELPGVTFFRDLGAHKVEVHIVRVPDDAFHLVVGLVGSGQVERRVVLHRGRRELAAEPMRFGSATFKSLRPGEYRIEIQEDGATVGFVTVDVEANVREETDR